VEGTGSVRYPTIIDGKLDQIILTNVHHMPGMDYNLLLVATLEQKGYSATIVNSRFDIMDSDKEKVLSGTRVSTSYLLDLKYSKTPHALKSSYNHPVNYCSWDEWHQRLAHLNIQDIKKLATMSEGININEVNRLQKLIPDHKLCEPCMMGKQTKEPSRQPRRQDPNKREIVKGAFIHSNLAGGGLIKQTLRGHSYTESFMDNATDITFMTMLKRKSDAPVTTKNHLNWISTQGYPVRRLSTDNKIIYTGHKVQNFLKERGIKWEPSTPYNPSQNPVTKRTFRTLFGRVRSILNDTGIP